MTTRNFRCEQMRLVLLNIELRLVLGARQLLMATKIAPSLGTFVSREYLRLNRGS